MPYLQSMVSHGRLRVASSTSASAALVPNALAVLAGLHPGPQLSLVDQDPLTSIQALKRYEVDLAVVYQDELPEEIAHSGVMQCELMTETLSLVVPRRHPMASRQRVALQSLSEDTWLIGHPGAHVLTFRACRAAGFDPRVA